MHLLKIWMSAGDINLFSLSLLIAITGIILVPFFALRSRSYLTSVLVIINSLLTTIPALHVLSGDQFSYIFSGLIWFGDIPLRIDPLAAWFIIIINITSVTGAVYGVGYMKKYEEQSSKTSLHWSLYLLFHSSMLWVCVIQNSLAFLVVWEIMSISSLLLVIFDHEKSLTLKAGINYLVQTHIGVVLLTIAFVWVAVTENSFDFNVIRDFFYTHRNIWLFLLFFVGFGFKAGFIPFHSWLPHAHPAAPSHISGVMSGVIVKLGIYGIFRMITFLNQDYLIIGEIVLAISLLSGLFGILNASVHRDFKKMLAFCTIENIGIIGLGIGIGLIGQGKELPLLVIFGFGGALLHTLNHSLFKSLLFYSVGSVYQQTHTRDMDKLGGLIKKMPHTALLFLVGAIAVGGLPPFNGFISEFVIYNGMLEGIKSSGSYHAIFMIISMAGLAIIGGVSILAFTKVFGTVFLGSPRLQLNTEPVEVSFLMRLPQYIIVVLILVVGIFPMQFFETTVLIVQSSFGLSNLHNTNQVVSVIENLTKIGRYSTLIIITGGLILLIKYVFTRKLSVVTLPTWGCGYVAPKSTMQYTSKSFSKSLGKLADFIVLEKKKYKEISVPEVFPAERKYSSHYNDFFEIQIINKLLNLLNYFMNVFQFVQNGRLQMYILYGLFFIIMIFMGTLFNFI